MSCQKLPLRELIKVHYGKALKEADRIQSGCWDVFGSSGKVGKHDKTLTEKPTIIIGRKGSVGEVAFAPCGGWTIDTAFYTEIIEPTKLDLRYLYYFLRRSNLKKHTITTSIPGINRDYIYDTVIALPLLSEQKRIAAILDKADAIRRKRRKAIQLADKFLRSVFLDMFGDPAVNPKKFPVKKIKNLLSSEKAGIRTGPFGSSLKKYEYIASGIPVWGIESVENGRFREQTSLFIDEKKFKQLKNYKVQSGDILISRAGTVGRMCVAMPTVENSIIGTNLIRVALDNSKLLPDVFVDLFVKFPKRISALRVNQKENAYSFLNPNILKDAQIPLPPIDFQREYLAIRQKTYQIIIKCESDMNTQSSLFSSLSQRAFHGEL